MGRPNKWDRKRPEKRQDLINEHIKFPKILLVQDDGTQSETTPSQAQVLADEKDLDLVCVAPKAQIPVCKIMDYGKYRFEQQKRAKENKKNQTVVSVKEIKMTPKTDKHDLDTKAKNAKKFLEKGEKVKVTIRFRGREITHKELGIKTLNSFVELVTDFAEVEKEATAEGRTVFMILKPIKK